jgi:hypothetical protein
MEAAASAPCGTASRRTLGTLVCAAGGTMKMLLVFSMVAALTLRKQEVVDETLGAGRLTRDSIPILGNLLFPCHCLVPPT